MIFQTESVAVTPDNPHVAMLIRFVVAAVCGALVATIHKKTSRLPASPSFSATLVILTILITGTTLVIGESVARAFSLVGALSIVRFRTVVQDTRDTAFVIFCVVVGMAAGLANYWILGMTVAVAGLAAILLYLTFRGALPEAGGALPWVLTVRTTLGQGGDGLGVVLAKYTILSNVRKVGTARGGAALETTLDLALKSGVQPGAVVEELNRCDGIQFVELAAAVPAA